MPKGLQELCDEMRCERVLSVREGTQCGAQVRASACVGVENATHPMFGPFDLVQALHGSQRHATNALDEAEAKHRRHRPQFSNRQRRDTLKRFDVLIDVAEMNARFAVGDQRNRDLVDAWVAREWASGKFGKLAIVACRQTGANLLQVLLHDVIVVEQPFGGRPGVDALGAGREQACVGVGEDASGVREAREWTRWKQRSSTGLKPLRTRYLARARREVVDPEEVTMDGTDEQFL